MLEKSAARKRRAMICNRLASGGRDLATFL